MNLTFVSANNQISKQNILNISQMIQNAIFLKFLFHMNLHMMLIYYFP